ncbi:hypothetical protein DL96DRAFT_1698505 [Flagelloscypha sp. PMI_526]|nr:hypothetical protein DL96DRAFT_1698505 [Flagelloscypha sp. PMI_526]
MECIKGNGVFYIIFATQTRILTFSPTTNPHDNMSSSVTVYTIGGSKHIGYFASLRLLDAGATITFLLRNPSVFDKDTTIQKYVSAGKARLVKGDALNEGDCRNGWVEASKDGPCQLYDFHSWRRGFILGPERGLILKPFNLCTQAYINVASTIPAQSSPNLICLSSVGMGKKSKSSIPLALRPMYGMIGSPLADKHGMERVAHHLGGITWDKNDLGEPSAEMMGGSNWTKHPGLPEVGSYKGKVIVVRAAILNDGECLADKKENAYRATTEELGGYFISRKDTGHFVAELCLGSWEKWGGKVVNVGY